MLTHSCGNAVQEDCGLLFRAVSPCIAQADVVTSGKPCNGVFDLVFGRGESVTPGFGELGAAYGRMLVTKGDMIVFPVV
jgi:hypothetical protein